jgi:hypothetical protein
MRHGGVVTLAAAGDYGKLRPMVIAQPASLQCVTGSSKIA